MRKRETENLCRICRHYHKYDEGEVCGVCGHRLKPQEEAALGGAGCGGSARAAATAGAGAAARRGRRPAAAMIMHVLLTLQEMDAEQEARNRSVFSFFGAAGWDHRNHAQIKAGLAALRVPKESRGIEDYARALLRPCDRDRDRDFQRNMDDKELELYLILQAIDVEQNGVHPAQGAQAHADQCW